MQVPSFCLMITWKSLGHIEGLCGKGDEGAHGDNAMGVEAEHISLPRVQLSRFHQGHGAVLRTFFPHPKPADSQRLVTFCNAELIYTILDLNPLTSPNAQQETYYWAY